MRATLAAVQAAPVFLDLESSMVKAVRLIEEAAGSGAGIVGFPEGFLPGHPGWVELLPFAERSQELGARLFRNALEVPSKEVEAVANACGEYEIAAVVGACERVPRTTGTLYNSQLFFDENGRLVQKHQKLVPTIGEKLVHAPGTTGTNTSCDTRLGTVSGLICGENSNPLAQYATALDYPSVHVAAWPAHFSPQLAMQDVIELVSGAFAYSLKCFVINAVSTVSDDMVAAYGQPDHVAFLEDVRGLARASVVAPDGSVISRAGGAEEQIVYAEVELDDVLASKMVHDIAGHYNRPEVFAHLFRPPGESSVPNPDEMS
jgi:nitrilase